VSQGRVPLSQPKVRKILDTTFWVPNFELLIIKNECGFSACAVLEHEMSALPLKADK
jgi:hypothetical protein